MNASVIRPEAAVIGQFLYSLGAVAFADSVSHGHFVLYAYEHPTARGGTVWWGGHAKGNTACWDLLSWFLIKFKRVFGVAMRGPEFKQSGEPYPRAELEVEFEAALALMEAYIDGQRITP